jgi:hypothetical protein
MGLWRTVCCLQDPMIMMGALLRRIWSSSSSSQSHALHVYHELIVAIKVNRFAKRAASLSYPENFSLCLICAMFPSVKLTMQFAVYITAHCTSSSNFPIFRAPNYFSIRLKTRKSANWRNVCFHRCCCSDCLVSGSHNAHHGPSNIKPSSFTHHIQGDY